MQNRWLTMKGSLVLLVATAVCTAQARNCLDAEYTEIYGWTKTEPTSTRLAKKAYECVCGGSSNKIHQDLQAFKWTQEKCLKDAVFSCDYDEKTAKYVDTRTTCESFYEMCVEPIVSEQSWSNVFRRSSLFERDDVTTCRSSAIYECDYDATTMNRVKHCPIQCVGSVDKAECTEVSPSEMFKPPSRTMLGDPQPQFCPNSFSNLAGTAACVEQDLYYQLRTAARLGSANPVKARTAIADCANDRLRAVHIDEVGKRLRRADSVHDHPESYFFKDPRGEQMAAYFDNNNKHVTSTNENALVKGFGYNSIACWLKHIKGKAYYDWEKYMAATPGRRSIREQMERCAGEKTFTCARIGAAVFEESVQEAAGDPLRHFMGAVSIAERFFGGDMKGMFNEGVEFWNDEHRVEELSSSEKETDDQIKGILDELKKGPKANKKLGKNVGFFVAQKYLQGISTFLDTQTAARGNPWHEGVAKRLDDDAKASMKQFWIDFKEKAKKLRVGPKDLAAIDYQIEYPVGLLPIGWDAKFYSQTCSDHFKHHCSCYNTDDGKDLAAANEPCHPEDMFNSLLFKNDRPFKNEPTATNTLKATLMDSSELYKLNSLADDILSAPTNRVTIVGYASTPEPKEDHNQELSKRRAELVWKELSARGGITNARLKDFFKLNEKEIHFVLDQGCQRVSLGIYACGHEGMDATGESRKVDVYVQGSV